MARRSGDRGGVMPHFACDLARSTTKPPHVWEHTVGSGHAALALRADWQWMLNGGATVSHGWKPERGFIWKLMRQCSYITTGLRRAGFKDGWL